MEDPSTVRFILSNPLHSCLELILEQYQIERAREQRFGSIHPLWGIFSSAGSIS
jgi:hypothetical protein